jgi:hypothetical protein
MYSQSFTDFVADRARVLRFEEDGIGRVGVAVFGHDCRRWLGLRIASLLCADFLPPTS